jgi:large subunit ribosomal protein L29
MMKASEVRAMNTAELEAKLDGLKKDLFFLRMQHATNQLDNPQKIADTKRDIARVKTTLRQRELAAAAPKQQ